ncbi:MAG: hypothetical protein J6T44_09155 [Prevotella sp.]|nr:hypothetical protein [Prevotella sp.]
MENLYAIYSYKLVKANDEGDWTQGEQVIVTDMDATQDWLYRLFGKTQNLFHVQKGEGESAKKYTCEVYGNDHRIVALRLLNIKEQSYWKLVKNPNDPMGELIKDFYESTPCTYVIIDCRKGQNTIAVKVETDAWRSTDTVCELMENSINHHLMSYGRGFRIKIYTKMQNHDFLDYSSRRIKKEGRTLKKMTIRFKTGQLNPIIEAFVKNSPYLKGLFDRINKYEGASGELTLNKPMGAKLIDRRRHDIETMIALIASDPQGYGMDWTFDDNVMLRYGKDSIYESPIDPEGSLELFHLGRKAESAVQLNLFSEEQDSAPNKYLLEGWLDKVAEETKKMKDAETVKPKRSRSNRRKVS